MDNKQFCQGGEIPYSDGENPLNSTGPVFEIINRYPAKEKPSLDGDIPAMSIVEKLTHRYKGCNYCFIDRERLLDKEKVDSEGIQELALKIQMAKETYYMINDVYQCSICKKVKRVRIT